MSGILLKPLDDKYLQYYKRKMQHKIPVEVSKIKNDEQTFSISIPMFSAQKQEKSKF